MNHDPSRNGSEPKGFWRSRYAIGLLVLGTIAAFFLLSEHRAHFFGVLPYLLILACPLMHVFMHHGHRGHGSGEKPDRPGKPGQASPGDPT
ncbi:Protein of unknown function [Polaromonas sp. OV174]|uniref:DUF2933 domain-containing protein n=1 Tax=Polaromonas sp. OV174 TaxID=1855300 RepID=UPI0008EE510B|nr:DUF2933 domain-containing protein [Polaromonas sp. OV174]SFC25454.1 Protein of unknown function [Polaromonas sp. OV174]